MKRNLAFILALLFALSGFALGEDMPVASDELLTGVVIEETDTVKRAQELLIGLGLLEGSADGIAGPITSEAIRAFQTAQGMAATGQLDPATLVALERVHIMPVKDVQQRLIDLGYLSGEADGKWGSRSKSAMALFQKLHDLEVTGEIDEVSVVRMNADDAIELPSGLNAGERGERVEAMQNALIRFGFLDGTADGIYGQNTYNAVKAFQNHLIAQGIADEYAITATGEATSATLMVLSDANYSPYVHDVAVGEEDAGAKRVETRLSALGYMDKPADNVLDEYAMESLALFREKAGLPESETVTRADFDALFSDSAPIADHCAPHDIALGDSGIMVQNVEEALCVGGLSIKLPTGKYNSDLQSAIERLYSYLKNKDDERRSYFEDSSKLSKEAVALLCSNILGYVRDVGGESKNETEDTRVQRRLHTLYYVSKSGVDGQFGTKSREAVAEFQKTNGLPETGIADRETQELLFSDKAIAKQLPYRVEVSLKRQRVEVYALNDAGEYDHIHSFICSTGLGNSTPRGIFLDGFPVNRWHYFSKFYCWAQYSFDIEGDIMFHSVIYSAASTSAVRMSSVYNLGSPASHGCIRLEVEAAKWLFENCPRGSLVIIIR